jgi:flagellar basal-body rod modification protein FlgD
MNPIGSTSSNPNTLLPDVAKTAASGKTDISKNMFMQLLVAQMKNQDPLNPSDSTQFLTQLAQFQQLEQGVNSGQDIAAMRVDLDKLSISDTAAAPATS